MIKDNVRQFLNLSLSIAQPVIAALANTGVTGPNIGVISNQYPTYVVPAGYAFSIWSLIFLLSLGYGAWQSLPAQRANSLLQGIGWMTASAMTATSVWMLVFQRSMFVLSVVVMLWLLVSLIGIIVRLYQWRGTKSGLMTWEENILVYGNFSIFLGWITVATVANIAQVLTAYGWSGAGLHLETWGIIVVIAAGIIACVVTHILHGNLPYAVTTVWAFIAVAVNQLTQAVPTSSIYVGISSLIVSVLVIVTLFIAKNRKLIAT